MTVKELLESIDWDPLRMQLGLDSMFSHPSLIGPPSTLVVLELRGCKRFVDVDQFLQESRSIFPVAEFRKRLTQAALELFTYEIVSAILTHEHLADVAERRGDIAGADAWRMVVEALDTAKRAAEKAGQQQTWDVEAAE